MRRPTTSSCRAYLLGLTSLIACSSKTPAVDGGTSGACASQSIGPAGGTVTCSDGTSVQIPAGALSATTTITITSSASAPPPSGAIWVGTPYLFGPEGNQFASPVTVTLAFVPGELISGTTSSNVSIYTAPAGSTSYTALPTTVADSTHVQAQVSHFSDFGPAELTGTACDPECSNGESCCGGACTDISSDGNNCGGCGIACNAAQSEGCCQGTCTSLNTPATCGGCDSSCDGAESTCCQDAPSAPASCADLSNDIHNCGECGNNCGVLGAAGSTCCQGSCVDINTTANCGGCGVACTGVASTCCQDSSETPAACADLSNDNHNCGDCGNNCLGGSACVNGSCQGGSSSGSSGSSSGSGGTCSPACTGGMTCCSGDCTRLSTDPFNCGACENACGAQTPLCVGGNCRGAGPTTEACDWGSLGCLDCCTVEVTGGVVTGLSCSTPTDCSASLTAIATKSFPNGNSYVLVGDYLGGGIEVYQVDPLVVPPTLTYVDGIPGLDVYDLEEFGDPILYAQANDGGTVGAPTSLYQWSLDPDGGLTPLSPLVVSGLVQGQPVIDQTNGFLFSEWDGQIGEAYIDDGGQVVPLIPAMVTVPGSTSNALAIAPVNGLLYAGSYVTYSDGGEQPMISQFTIGPMGLLTPAATPTVAIPYQPDHLVAVEPDGGGPFVYVLGHDSSFTEHLDQFTTSSGSLVPQSPAEVSVCNPSFTMTPDSTDNLLLVACTQASQIAAYTMGATGALTETSWSPASVPNAPGQLSVFTTH